MSSRFFQNGKTFEDRVIEAFDHASLQRIAGLMDVNYHTLRNWLKETRDIPPEELAKIAKLTNRSLDWLLLGKEDAEPLLNEAALVKLINDVLKHAALAGAVTRWSAEGDAARAQKEDLGLKDITGEVDPEWLLNQTETKKKLRA